MLGKVRKKRVPQLKFTRIRDIGWHVSYRDPKTGTPRKHRFGLVNREEADRLYHDWVARYLRGELPEKTEPKRRRKPTLKTEASNSDLKGVAANVVEGSLLHIASSSYAMKNLASETTIHRGAKAALPEISTSDESSTQRNSCNSSTPGIVAVP